MDEPTAWLAQAKADYRAAEQLVASMRNAGQCHAIAKWQQTVEKTIKALVSALYHARILTTNFQAKHSVARYIRLLLDLPRDLSNRPIQRLLFGLLDQKTRAGIESLDGLAPSFPLRRNTKYPFPDTHGVWNYPAATEIFTAAEVHQFRELAHRILDGSQRVVAAIRHRPRRR